MQGPAQILPMRTIALFGGRRFRLCRAGGEGALGWPLRLGALSPSVGPTMNGIDPMTDDLAGLAPAIATVQVDNDEVRVTRYHFPPGSQTGWHRHGHDYVVVPTIGGTLTIVEPDGRRRQLPYRPSESYFRTLGAEHNVVNISDGAVEFVEIEIKKTIKNG